MVKSCRKSKVLYIFIFLTAAVNGYGLPKLALVCEDKKPHQQAITDSIKAMSALSFEIIIFLSQKDKDDDLKESLKNYQPDYQIILGNRNSDIAYEAAVPTIVSLSYNLDKLILKNENVKWFVPFPSPEYSFKIIDRILKYPTMAALIYCPDNNRVLAQKFIDAEAEKLFMVEYHLSDPGKSVQKFEAVKNRVQMIFSIPDSVVFNKSSVSYLKRFSVLNKKPVIGFNKQSLKRGAFMAFYLTDKQIADEIFSLLRKLQSDPSAVSSLTIPATGTYSINSKMTEILKISLPEDVISLSESLE